MKLNFSQCTAFYIKCIPTFVVSVDCRVAWQLCAKYVSDQHFKIVKLPYLYINLRY